MKNLPLHLPINPFLPMTQRRFLAALAILVLFLLNAAWNAPYSSRPSQPGRVAATRTLSPTPSTSNLANTPSPEEILANRTQTNGVVIVGGIIVLVIVAGTFFVLRRKS